MRELALPIVMTGVAFISRPDRSNKGAEDLSKVGGEGLVIIEASGEAE